MMILGGRVMQKEITFFQKQRVIVEKVASFVFRNNGGIHEAASLNIANFRSVAKIIFDLTSST